MRTRLMLLLAMLAAVLQAAPAPGQGAAATLTGSLHHADGRPAAGHELRVNTAPTFAEAVGATLAMPFTLGLSLLACVGGMGPDCDEVEGLVGADGRFTLPLDDDLLVAPDGRDRRLVLDTFPPVDEPLPPLLEGLLPDDAGALGPRAQVSFIPNQHGADIGLIELWEPATTTTRAADLVTVEATPMRGADRYGATWIGGGGALRPQAEPDSALGMRLLEDYGYDVVLTGHGAAPNGGGLTLTAAPVHVQATEAPPSRGARCGTERDGQITLLEPCGVSDGLLDGAVILGTPLLCEQRLPTPGPLLVPPTVGPFELPTLPPFDLPDLQPVPVPTVPPPSERRVAGPVAPSSDCPPGPDAVIVDLGATVDLGQVVVRFAGGAPRLDVSDDRSSWRPLGSPVLRELGVHAWYPGSRARYLRVERNPSAGTLTPGAPGHPPPSPELGFGPDADATHVLEVSAWPDADPTHLPVGTPVAMPGQEQGPASGPVADRPWLLLVAVVVAALMAAVIVALRRYGWR